jgi:hypothetical protein
MGVGSRGYGDSVWALGRGGGGAGEQARRWPGKAAAAAAVPGDLGLGASVGAARQLAWVLGEVEESSH